MITQFQVGGLLRQELPQFNLPQTITKPSLEIYAAMSAFCDYTRHAVQNDTGLARKCFSLAETFYRNGDSLVRLAVSNIFVYSFSTLLPQDSERRKAVRTLIPASLYSIYLNQVMQPGC